MLYGMKLETKLGRLNQMLEVSHPSVFSKRSLATIETKETTEAPQMYRVDGDEGCTVAYRTPQVIHPEATARPTSSFSVGRRTILRATG